MSRKPQATPPPLHERIRFVLERNGHALQHAVIEAVHSGTHQHNWHFQAWELPVASGDVDTKIDTVLRYGNTKRYIVAECKRVDARWREWCFFRAPRIIAGEQCRPTELFMGEIVTIGKGPPEMAGRQRPFAADFTRHVAGEFVNLALAAPGDAQELPNHSGDLAIDDAAYQACKGVIGLVSHLDDIAARSLNAFGRYVITPIVVTTAPLHVVSGPSLSTTQLRDGKLTEAPDSVAVPWVFYQYHKSVSLVRLTFDFATAGDDIGQTLRTLYIRTVPIVHAEHLNRFLKFFGDIDFLRST